MTTPTPTAGARRAARRFQADGIGVTQDTADEAGGEFEMALEPT